jgi:hypothetical protein
LYVIAVSREPSSYVYSATIPFGSVSDVRRSALS